MNEIESVEHQVMELSAKLAKLRRDAKPILVKNYTFETLEGKRTLLDLFAGKDILFAVHNMGQACRYCTLWADGINAWVPHFEDQFAMVLLSKDTPEAQRRFANTRGWRFRMASHGGGDYAKDQTVMPEHANAPGIVVYTRKGDQVFRRNASKFGPGDQFCSAWHLLSLAGIGGEDWTPQYRYWKAPEKMEDGGRNLR